MPESSPAPVSSKAAASTARLWSRNGFLANPWRMLGADEPVPAGGFVVMPLARWRENLAELSDRGHTLGIEIHPDDTLDPVADEVARIGLIALNFPKFTDGRAYSTARRLREQWGFEGEIRARGDVLLDQIPLMLRCGFDTFEITHAATIRALEAAPVPALLRIYQGPARRGDRSWFPRRAFGAGDPRVDGVDDKPVRGREQRRRGHEPFPVPCV